MSQETQETKTQAATRPTWHASDASAVAQELGVEPEHGLSVEEARRRLQSQGPNRLAGAKKESGLQAFLRQQGRDDTRCLAGLHHPPGELTPIR